MSTEEGIRQAVREMLVGNPDLGLAKLEGCGFHRTFDELQLFRALDAVALLARRKALQKVSEAPVVLTSEGTLRCQGERIASREALVLEMERMSGIPADRLEFVLDWVVDAVRLLPRLLVGLKATPTRGGVKLDLRERCSAADLFELWCPAAEKDAAVPAAEGEAAGEA